MATADCSLRFKKSVVAVYETETFRSLLKDILHPGGLDLTRRLGETVQLGKGSTFLDIACGKGESVFLLAEAYGCRAVGIDLSPRKIVGAAAAATERGLDSIVSFLVSDAEGLPFADAAFDVVISECSFSVLPCKERAASEIARVLKPGGRLVMTDIVAGAARTGGGSHESARDADLALPCIAGALPVAGYIEILEARGLCDAYVEDHSKELKKIGYQIAMTFGSWENFMQSLSSDLCCSSFEKEGYGAGPAGRLGYALIRLTKPS